MRLSRAALKFFKTPKGLLTIILVVLAGLAAPHEGVRAAAPGWIGAVLVAALFDGIILRLRKKAWEFPSGAILTAMIVAMVLRAQEPWYVTAATALIGIAAKYVVRSRHANVLNPAAFGIVVSFYLFHTGQSWWGALPEVSPIAQAVMVAAGAFIADRVNKMPMVLTFLGIHYL